MVSRFLFFVFTVLLWVQAFKSLFGARSDCKSRVYEPGVVFFDLFDPPNAPKKDLARTTTP